MNNTFTEITDFRLSNLLKTVKNMGSFIKEIAKENDRGLTVVAAAMIDDCLLKTLSSFFVENGSSNKLLKGENAPIRTLSARVKLCYALGLIDDYEKSEIELIRKIRNDFAHIHHRITFTDEKIQGFCASLTSPLPEGDDHPARFRFTIATVCVVTRLLHRPEQVELERREATNWGSVRSSVAFF